MRRGDAGCYRWTGPAKSDEMIGNERIGAGRACIFEGQSKQPIAGAAALASESPTPNIAGC